MSALEWVVLPGVFLLIAAVYSSVGLGGGSSYLAVLSVFLVDFYAIRTQALLCNLAVVAVGCWLAWRHGSLHLRTAWPYVLFSIPAALLGAMVRLEERTFFLMLGATLIVSAAFLFFRTDRDHRSKGNSSRLPAALGLGGGIGFFSGLVGIGGGIFLSPILHLLRWETARQVAGIASFFILVNSVSGISGLVVSGTFQPMGWLTVCLIAAVLAGSFLGTRWSIRWLNARMLQRVTALLVLFVGLRLLYQHGL